MYQKCTTGFLYYSYKSFKAIEKINERIRYYQAQFDVKPKKVVIKDQEKRWGSCTKDNQLLFSTGSASWHHLVVHEMLNHSKEFWYLLKRVLPDYEHNGIKYDL